jgi:hypothetical protein
MGMFDYVHCAYPLPDKEAQDIEFQTKDFHCLMTPFFITREGRLTAPSGDDLDYHGDLYIYGGEEPFMHPWFEYVVRFTDGTVSKVTRVGSEGQTT